MNRTIHSCIGCGDAVETLIGFGLQPPSNRFLMEGEQESDFHRLILGQCASCGLIQLVDPMPVGMVKSRFSWLTYNEPEGHLDALADTLTQLPGIGQKSLIGGLTYKDDSTLNRLARLGLSRNYRLSASEDLGLDDPAAGLESIQECLRENRTRTIVATHGQADLVVVRHVLEHAHDPRAFLHGLASLMSPEGYLVLEVPDSRKFIDACDYSFIWEEHISYFSPATLKALLEKCGFQALEILVYPYALEDSLVAIARLGKTAGFNGTEALAQELARGRQYARQLPQIRDRYRKCLAQLKMEGKRVVLFGAGHLAAKFINLLQLGEFVDCVLDDNPHKQALAMPGSRLPIRKSALLDAERIDLCLLSLSPESEKRILDAKRAYLDRGGVFRSIFALSPIALSV